MELKRFGTIASLFVLVLVILSPLRLVFSTHSNDRISISSIFLFWTMTFDSPSTIVSWWNEPMVAFGYGLFCGLRFILPVQLFRFYRGKSSLHMVIVSVIIGEVPPLLFALTLPLFMYPYIGPVPLQVLATVLFLAYRRPIGPVTPWDEYEESLEEIYS